jgi:cation transport regulator
MVYKTLGDLPERVKSNLPEHAQKIFLSAFNNAWEEFKEPQELRGMASREETAHKAAWAAVKNQYRQDESGKWFSI